MARISGNGKFVGIGASNSGGAIAGFVFGVNNTGYCRIASRYTSTRSGVVTGTALSVEPYGSRPLCLSFQELNTITINGRTGYTGTIRVVSDMKEEGDNYRWRQIAVYTNYGFKCGLLTNVYE